VDNLALIRIVCAMVPLAIKTALRFMQWCANVPITQGMLDIMEDCLSTQAVLRTYTRFADFSLRPAYLTAQESEHL
jgi:hypothetical protein